MVIINKANHWHGMYLLWALEYNMKAGNGKLFTLLENQSTENVWNSIYFIPATDCELIAPHRRSIHFGAHFIPN